MEREYVVSLCEGVDYDKFWDEMETLTHRHPTVPDRAVDIVNERVGSLRSCHYALTDAEADLLRADPRVYCVEIPVEQRPDIRFAPVAVQTGNFVKTGLATGNSVNWGLRRCVSPVNPYGTGTTATNEFPYTLDGTGVDVVIHDSGLQVDHPEFAGRVQLIDWFAASGISGTQSPNFYRDYHGHGTHVAGIVAGKTYGWAKGAQIYSMKLASLEGAGDSGTGISATYAFDTIKLWHLSKPIINQTGFRRPTIVNMSWAATSTFANITGGNYRGTTWTGTARRTDYGMIGDASSTFGVRAGSVDVDIQEMIAAGIIICTAAGNFYQKNDISGGLDYNNYYTNSSNQTIYYHRGSTPYDDSAVVVGSIDSLVYNATTEQKSTFSNAGPAVAVYAPGSGIVSSVSTTNAFSSSSATYYANSNYKQANLSGTSMASPQVAGMLACYLQVTPWATSAQAKAWIINQSTNVLYSTGLANDYTNNRSLLGGTARVLNTPFSSSTPMQVSGINLAPEPVVPPIPPVTPIPTDAILLENATDWLAMENGDAILLGDLTPIEPTINPGQTFSCAVNTPNGTIIGTVAYSGNVTPTTFVIDGTGISISSAGVLTKTGTLTAGNFTRNVYCTRSATSYTSPTVSIGITVSAKAYLAEAGDNIILTPSAWTAGQQIIIGDRRSNANKIYQAASSGAAGATAPTHTGGTVSDGNVNWTYEGFTYNWVQGQVVAVGTRRTNAGRMYEATTAGTTGSIAPTHSSGTASDGVVTWLFLCTIDYTSVASWSASISGTLSAPRTGILWNLGPVEAIYGSSAIDLNFGSTVTDTVNRITLKAKEEDAWYSDVNRVSQYTPSKGVAIRGTQYSRTIQIVNFATQNITIKGLQISTRNGAIGTYGNAILSYGASGVVISQCIIQGAVDNSLIDISGLIKNSVIIRDSVATSSAPVTLTNVNGTAQMVNCTVVRPSNYAAGGLAFGSSYGSAVVINTIAAGFTVAPGGTFAVSCTNNAATNTTAIPGSNKVSIPSMSTEFVQPSAASGNLNVLLLSTAASRNAGVDSPSGADPTDAVGTTRQSPWDIGAYEYV